MWEVSTRSFRQDRQGGGAGRTSSHAGRGATAGVEPEATTHRDKHGFRGSGSTAVHRDHFATTGSGSLGEERLARTANRGGYPKLDKKGAPVLRG